MVRIFVFSILAMVATLGSAVEKRPNIVVIMGDDVGLGDVAYHYRGDADKPTLVPTPTLDKLAGDGMWFTDAHSPTALCSPSRYCMMTGNNSYRSYAPWGVWQSYRRNPVEESDATLGRVCQDAGYATAFVGKWHLGGDFKRKSNDEIYRGEDRSEHELDIDTSKWIGGGPSALGFDYSFVLPAGIQGPVYIAYENEVWYPFSKDSKLIGLNDSNALDPAYLSDKGPGPGDSHWDPRPVNEMIATKSADFIRANAGEKPFFLCHWSPAVHLPHIPPAMVGDRVVKGETPTHHLDMMLALDKEIELIVEALKETGVYEDTLIIFTSDNGGLADGKGEKAGHNSNGGWRGYKNQIYEGGHRVPFIASWPNGIEAGQISDELVVGTDIVATIADLAGSELQDGQALDSQNLAPLLKGESGYQSRERMMIQSGSYNEVLIREGPWKLIIDTDHKLSFWEPIGLFNLDNSPKESDEENLIGSPEQKVRVDAMLKRYLTLREDGTPTAQGR